MPEQRDQLEAAAKQDACNHCKYAALEVMRRDREQAVPHDA
jgi:hypothetical protein